MAGSRRYESAPGRPARIELDDAQRRKFQWRALVSAGSGLLLAAAMTVRAHWNLWVLVGIGAVFCAIGGYYLRIAYGWVRIEPGGLRTSRLLRGRFIPWQRMAGLEARTYGSGYGPWEMTLVRVVTHRRSGYFLPAPRTTARGGPGFDQPLESLRAELARHSPHRDPILDRDWYRDKRGIGRGTALFLAIFMLVTATGLVCALGYQEWRAYVLRTRGIAVTATVLAQERNGRDVSSLVAFLDDRNETTAVWTDVGDRPHVGDLLELVYDPRDPENIGYPVSSGDLWLAPVLAVVAGGLFFWLARMFWRAYRLAG